MSIKSIRSISLVLGILLFLLPLVVFASSSVANHKPERKILLISGYDFPNILLNQYARVHTRNESGTEQDVIGWQSVIDYLALDKDTLASTIGLTNTDFILFSYSNVYDPICTGATGFGCPRYTAGDTCLTSTNRQNRLGYCQVEEPAIAKVAGYITEIMNKPEYANAEFDIIAHSEGGLVATYWAATASSTQHLYTFWGNQIQNNG